MGKSLEHKMLQGLVFLMRGRVGPVRLVGRVGGPLEEGGFSDWSGYCPKKVCKLQSSYICVMNKKSTKNNEAYKRTKIGINF